MDVAINGVPRPRSRRLWRIPVPLTLMVVLGWGLPQPGQGAPKRYDPDRDTCQVEAIRRAYQANMLPWGDQPEVVLQRLRQLQAAMTLDTLRDCQARGLLSADQAASLETELRLRSPGGSSPETSEAPQSPTRP
ncbi:MAG: hypothetical protein VKP70_10765 [Cyanobacteriota bacterium]|nr:hypothetical protein [Cyanobacteriota bacterium]